MTFNSLFSISPHPFAVELILYPLKNSIMIGYLQGFPKEKSPPKLLLLVNDVGYELQTPLSTFEQLPNNEAKIGFYTHLIPREDALLLFGFLTLEERELFRDLIKINNIGPKLALSILSHLNVQQFIECLMAQDHVRLNRVPGLGKKTTERLLIEMRDRINHFSVSSSVTNKQPYLLASPLQEAMNALSTLGYKPAEAQRLLSQASPACDTVEDWIKAALKENTLKENIR